MRKIVKKNESYSKLMITEGANTIVDEDSNFVMELPEWADEEKVKRAQKFLLLNMNAMARAMFFGMMAVLPVESLIKILIFTKQSSTPALAYRRFKANALHVQLWSQNPIKPGTLAWQSLHTVRKMHVVVNKRSTRADVGIVSQKDMAITQFLFIGFSLLAPEMFGVVGSYEQLDALNHLWRLVGYMLGTQDQFNACGETVEETQSRLQSIAEDMLVPGWKDPFPECLPYSKVTFDGLWTGTPTAHYDTTMFMIKRAIGVPGYYWFDSESSGFEEENRKLFEEMSLFTKFNIFLDIIIYEYLSHVFIFRWIFNVLRFFMALLDVYPFLALIRFGKKYAIVEVMKKKKAN
ncbi:hypothetical protein HA402_000206 [Bradysia odoriphaga]|nr:hypothetical protein HA402_000206 [Bradysia odoriphaga]